MHFHNLGANDEYDAASCAAVAGTSNIRWENLDGTWNYCTGTELSNLTFDSESRIAEFDGYAVVNDQPGCLATGTYTFDLSADGLALQGEGDWHNIPMTLTRVPGQDCFVGLWVSDAAPFDDWLAHIAVDAFPAGTIAPELSCEGFAPPAHAGPVRAKKGRAIPYKFTLFSADGFEVTGADLAAAPVIQVSFEASGGDSVDVSGDALPVGKSSEGNTFSYTDEHWQYNLNSANHTAAGTYHVSVVSGDTTEYHVYPTCEAAFVIE